MHGFVDLHNKQLICKGCVICKQTADLHGLDYLQICLSVRLRAEILHPPSLNANLHPPHSDLAHLCSLQTFFCKILHGII